MDGWLCGGGTGIGLLELTGFGLSLEQPTVTEQTISTAAKMSALVFLPQVLALRVLEPQATDSVFAMVRSALVRVIVVASCRRSGTSKNALGVPREIALIWWELG